MIEALPSQLQLEPSMPPALWSRSSLHHRPKGESAENLALMRRIDELFSEVPVPERTGQAESRRRRNWTGTR